MPYKDKEKEREWKRNNYKKNTHLPCVYYLPEEHYIGVTVNMQKRLSDHHKTKITEGYEILCYCERIVDAHYIETLFHMRGYNGFRC